MEEYVAEYLFYRARRKKNTFGGVSDSNLTITHLLPRWTTDVKKVITTVTCHVMSHEACLGGILLFGHGLTRANSHRKGTFFCIKNTPILCSQIYDFIAYSLHGLRGCYHDLSLYYPVRSTFIDDFPKLYHYR